MKQYCFDVAKEIRPYSDCSIKIGAVLERGGRILAVACNMKGSMRINGIHYEYSRHAEGRLLSNALSRRTSLGNTTVYTYRQHGLKTTPMVAKPCQQCLRLLSEAGVSKVFYTIENGYDLLRLR